MKFDNIIKKLKKDGYNVEVMQFSFQTCLGVTGTALIDIVDGNIIQTNAKYIDVINQISKNRSHIQTIETINGCRKKILTDYLKL